MNNENILVNELIDGFENLTTLDSEISNQIDLYFNETDKEIDRCIKSSSVIERNNKEITSTILPSIISNEEEMLRLSKALSAMENDVFPALNNDLDQIENVIQILEDKLKKDKKSSSLSSIFNRFVSSPSKKEEIDVSISNIDINLTSKETLIKSIDID